MEKIRKFLDVDVRAAEGEPRTYWFTASTDTRDRQGDVIVQDGWKLQNFKKNPVILWGHDYYSTPIGKATTVRVEDGKLRIKVEFVPESIDPFAAKIEKLVASGYLQTVSVGFTTYKVEDLTDEEKKKRPEMPWGKRLFGELLEVSVVPVPANPQALLEREMDEVCAKSFGHHRESHAAEEIESPLLNYKDADGSVNGLKLRACVAAVAGARGGVKINENERMPITRHLYRIAKENSVALPEQMPTDQESLRKEFTDVWHGELLDIVEFDDEVEQKESVSETDISSLVEDINEVIKKLK
jgi:HK97 family phage prohead protease